jgi:transposase-like protein
MTLTLAPNELTQPDFPLFYMAPDGRKNCQADCQTFRPAQRKKGRGFVQSNFASDNRAALHQGYCENLETAQCINTESHSNTLQTMDSEALRAQLAEHSVAETAIVFGVNRRTIYRWCKTFGIPRRVYGCPNYELLCQLENEGILQKEIARRFGVSRWTIWSWCKRFGIIHHTTGRFRKGTKGNQSDIHEEMPFGIGVLFDLDDDDPGTVTLF